jgi:S-adenosylmethionine hydrolase
VSVSAKVISLTTDFGLKDSYVGEIKGVILSLCPDATLVDLTHGVEKFNVRMGAFMLSSSAPYFPKGTVHMAIVDPGVGTQRRPIIVETTQGFFVGPDNGLLILAAEAQGIKQTRVIESRLLMLPHVSNTFHGRDIFAPVAAQIANGLPFEEFGPQIADIVKPEFTQVIRRGDSLEGEVLYVDDFGNIITNIHRRDMGILRESIIQIEFLQKPRRQMKLSTTYADAQPKKPIAIIGSHNYLEIALNQGNAAAEFSVKAGDKITVSRT